MAEWTHLCAQAQRNLLIPVGEQCDRCGMPYPEPGIQIPEPTVTALRAMYDAQCACTDEWARKYDALCFKKSDKALTERIAELEGQLAVFGGRPLTAKSLATDHFRRNDPEAQATAAGFLECALEHGLLEQDGEYLTIAWWSEFGKGMSESRDAWRTRKERQRARAKGAGGGESPPADPPAKPVPEGMSRDSHGNVTACPANVPSQTTNTTNTTNTTKTTKTNNQINQSKNGRPVPPLPKAPPRASTTPSPRRAKASPRRSPRPSPLRPHSRRAWTRSWTVGGSCPRPTPDVVTLLRPRTRR